MLFFIKIFIILASDTLGGVGVEKYSNDSNFKLLAFILLQR